MSKMEAEDLTGALKQIKSNGTTISAAAAHFELLWMHTCVVCDRK